jgi:hypothetical protein
MVGRLWRGASETVKDLLPIRLGNLIESCIPVVLNQAGTRFSNRETSTVWTFDGTLSQSRVVQSPRAMSSFHRDVIGGNIIRGRGEGLAARGAQNCFATALELNRHIAQNAEI